MKKQRHKMLPNINKNKRLDFIRDFHAYSVDARLKYHIIPFIQNKKHIFINKSYLVRKRLQKNEIKEHIHILWT